MFVEFVMISQFEMWLCYENNERSIENNLSKKIQSQRHFYS